MADLKSTPGGQPHKRNQMYRDDGDGTHSEAVAANIWIWDTDDLDWVRATAADFGGGGGGTVDQGSGGLSAWLVTGTVSIGNTATVTVPSIGSSVTVVQATASNLKVDASGATVPVSLAASSSTITTKEVRAASSTVVSVGSSATNVTLLASNTARLGASVFNDSTQNLYLKLGATATTAVYSALLYPSGYYEVPFGYTGIIDGLWSSANGAARVTELTA